MRKLALVLLAVLVAVLMAAPVQASSGESRDVLGSGAEVPDEVEEELPPAPEEPPVKDDEVEVADAPAEDLAATGFDSMAALLVGVGLVTAGGGALWTARRRSGA